MNLADWARREDLQLRLSETLKEAHVVEALSVLVQMGLPSAHSVMVADINMHALTNAWRDGYYKCLSNLERLKEVKESETKPMPAPWKKERVRRELE